MLKIGIIGTGYFGEIHLKVLLELKNKFKLIGFNDVDKKRSQFITKTYNLPFFSLNELIKKSDVISICSKTSSHFNILKTVITNNKHVLVEKPICENINEIYELKRLLQNSKSTLQVGFIERFNPAYLNLKSINFVPKSIQCIRETSLLDRNKNNSIIHDLMIHDIDLINTIINSSPKSVKVMEKRKNKVNCVINFQNDCRVELTSERTNEKKTHSRIMNIKTVDNDEIKLDLSNHKISINGKIKASNNNRNINQLKEEYNYLYKSIFEKKENMISLEAAEKCSIITELIELK
tara:strand:- start:722 stop:1600 length:879 start_codon:yes stop_codon:yes gene_type:complete